jgi:hypothetical protein
MALYDRIIARNLLLKRTCDNCGRPQWGGKIMKRCPKIDMDDEIDPIPTCDYHIPDLDKMHK